MTCQKLSLILCISCFLAFSQNNPNFANLPKPVLDDHPNWLVLYDSAWVIAKKNIKERFPNTNYVQWHIDEAMSYWKIWQWDFCFITMFSKYSNREFPMIEQLENFYMSQRANGFICRELYVENMKDVLPDPTSSSEAINKDPPNPNPPLYSMAEWDYYLVTGDMSHFTKQITSCRPDEPAQTKTVFQRIVDNYWWIKNNIRHSDGFYTSDYYANGMDDSPRNSIGAKGGWLCITTQQGLNALYIAKIADLLGNTTVRDQMMNEYSEHKNLVNSKMWDPTDGFYYDVTADRKLYKGWNNNITKTIASFWPLLAEIPTADQAKKLLAHLTNPAEFWIQHLIPTLSKDSYDYNGPTGEYWRGAIWAPTNYSTVRGLEKYGYDSIAKLIAENHIENMSKLLVKGGVFQSDGKTYYTIWENYAAELIAPSKDSYPNFVGWSGLGPIAMMIENVLGLRLNAKDNNIKWHMLETSRFGINNLKFNTGLIKSMICAKRAKTTDIAQVTIETDKSFSLTCRIGGVDYTQNIAIGKNTYSFGPGTGTNNLPEKRLGAVKVIGNYPNPFKKSTKISYRVERCNAHVRIDIYNVSGQFIQTIVNQQKQPGTYMAEFDGHNHTIGVYYYKVSYLNKVETGTMMIIQ